MIAPGPDIGHTHNHPSSEAGGRMDACENGGLGYLPFLAPEDLGGMQ